MFVYTCTARCLGSQSAAALPCLTQKVEHFVFQLLYRAVLALSCRPAKCQFCVKKNPKNLNKSGFPTLYSIEGCVIFMRLNIRSSEHLLSCSVIRKGCPSFKNLTAQNSSIFTPIGCISKLSHIWLAGPRKTKTSFVSGGKKQTCLDLLWDWLNDWLICQSSTFS